MNESARDDVKLLLVLMVKNESHIIARCLESALPFVDAVLVADTGSSDETVAQAEKVVREASRPFKAVTDAWQDFGHNRTLSLKAARTFAGEELRWLLHCTYAVALDADMQLKGDPAALRALVATANLSGALFKQVNGGLEYYNARLLRLSDEWYCEGVTHEYWTGGGATINAPPEAVWIADVGDGGSKSNKFARDEGLLLGGLDKNPRCERYMFYLAQTYHCMGRHLDAIHWYKKRISAGGWVEEVWYSHLMIARTYLHLKKPIKAEIWVHLGREIQPDRVEGVLSLVTHFREDSQHHKAWHYLKQAEGMKKPQEARLFLEVDAYAHRLDYERTILHYYVHPTQLSEGAAWSLKYEGPQEHSVMSNLTFYAEKLFPDARWQRLDFPAPEGYTSSSVAINVSGKLCVRTVSYRITDRGDYVMPSGRVETRNFSAQWDAGHNSWADWTELAPEAACAQRWRREDLVRGLEDVRLCGTTFTATTREFSYCSSSRMVHGTFPEMSFRPVKPPGGETACEKNWLPVSTDQVIYAWHPLRVGTVCTDGDLARLDISLTHATPSWFRHLRGSAPPVALSDGLWTLTHVVCPRSPRHYLHVWVLLEKETLRPLSHSPPFCFRHKGIEYCLGVTAPPRAVETLGLFVSVWDRESWYCEVPVEELRRRLQPM